MEHLNMQTPDGAQLNLDALYKICPSCFTETTDADGNIKKAVDFAKLRALLGDDAVEDAPEAYDFTWVGKRAAQREAAAPINKTLRPCPEDSVDWENTKNLYIEGDNLEVLKLLQNSYMGKVKMIYIDPPYNTGNDFVYHDDFAVSADEYDEHNINEDGERFRKNTDSNGRFHSDWCSMMYARLMVARTLLREDGVIFISIDDNEIKDLLNICGEIFGEKNYIATFKWNRVAKAPSLSNSVRTKYEYVLAFYKDKRISLFGKESYNKQGPLWHLPNKRTELLFPANSIRIKQSYAAGNYGGTYQVELLDDIEFENGLNKRECRVLACSAWGQARINEYVNKGNTFEIKKEPTTFYTDLDSEGNFIAPSDLISLEECGVKRNTDANEDMRKLGIPFDYTKPVSLIEYLVKMVTYNDKDAVVIDFFSGSATTANAVMNINSSDLGKRNFIMVQFPEIIDKSSEAGKLGFNNICEIGEERIRRSGAKIKANTPLTTQNLDTGFRVFKCDSSNMKDVYFSPKDLNQEDLFDQINNIKEDRTDLDLLFDCMLRWGVELSMPLTSQKVGACTIHNVNDGDLVACFDGTITDEIIDTIAAMAPLRVVFRDSSFPEAAQKMNLFELFKQKCGWSDYEVRNNVKVI